MSNESEIDKNIEKEKALFTKYVEEFFVTLAKPSYNNNEISESISNIDIITTETSEYIGSPYDILKSQNQVYVCEVIEKSGNFIIKYRVKNNVENVDNLNPLLPFLLSKGDIKISFESDNNISNTETFFVLSLNKDILTTELNDYHVANWVLFPSIEHSFMENLFLEKNSKYIEAKTKSIKKININHSTEIISNSSKDLINPKSTSSSSSTVTKQTNISLFFDSILNIKTSAATPSTSTSAAAPSTTTSTSTSAAASAAAPSTTPSTAAIKTTPSTAAITATTSTATTSTVTTSTSTTSTATTSTNPKLSSVLAPTKPIRKGIINPGNNCYLNALAQLLITIPEIRNIFSNSKEPDFIKKNKEILEKYYQLQMFRTMFILSNVIGQDFDEFITKNQNLSPTDLNDLYYKKFTNNKENQKKEQEMNKYKQEILSQLYSESCSSSGKSCQDLNKLFNDEIELTYSIIQFELIENIDKKSLLKYLLNQIFKNIEGGYNNLSFEPLIFPLLLFENLGQQEVNEAFQIMENILNDNETQDFFKELTISISTRQQGKDYDTIVKEKILFLGNDIKEGESISSLIQKYDSEGFTNTIVFSTYVIFYIRRETFSNDSRGINNNNVKLTDVENNGQTYKPIGVIVRIGGVGGGHFYYVDLDTQTKYNDSFVSECNNCLNNQEVLSGCRMVLYKKQEKINYTNNPVFKKQLLKQGVKSIQTNTDNNPGFGVSIVEEVPNALKQIKRNQIPKNPGGSNKFRVSRRKQKKHK